MCLSSIENIGKVGAGEDVSGQVLPNERFDLHIHQLLSLRNNPIEVTIEVEITNVIYDFSLICLRYSFGKQFLLRTGIFTFLSSFL